ncbi:hypothetical protein [Kamptonema formosum]|uniref:hypothetical protein n=1 Tax=Kamptonema formosum TaxID=331992 RepID=UPI000381A31B|nr:hypothetical protein [Oscillatoria sp. PCC 10802]
MFLRVLSYIKLQRWRQPALGEGSAVRGRVGEKDFDCRLPAAGGRGTWEAQISEAQPSDRKFVTSARLTVLQEVL